MDQRLVLFCQCHLTAHNVVVERVFDDEDIAVSVALNHYLPWYRRVVVGLRYILGSDNTSSHYDEVVLRKEDVAKLREFLV